ncbi:elongation factor P [Candidatus Gracilibacteria bacterium HOT-871]|nr:elongation factor P [Candidatus Gracilibacteria bacterium HOT-871]MBB1565289.1 elongation factor P [Candidatus Gracilibacteria bacterium]MBF0913700.1 elongation factor P [Candidatus Gracilibacteria bacterium]
MLNASELKVGKRFIMDGEPYEVTSYSQKVVGRGGSIINIKAKNLIRGGSIPKTFSDKDNFQPAEVTTSNYDYLYNDGMNYYFMNQNTFEQVSLELSALDGAELFLQEGDKVMLQEFNGLPINVNLEPTCILEVIETPPGEKGDTATGGKKPATMNTGLVIQVPLFINVGDKLVIDTRTKEYRSRA